MSGGGSPYLPPVMSDVVVDISHYQRQVDFAAVKAAGILAAILKASEGLAGVDPSYSARRGEAAAAGLLVGAYHFLDGSDAESQAEHFLSVAGEVPLLALDLERNPGGSSATPETAACAASRIRERRGQWPVIYVSRWALAMPHPILSQCALWLPEYGMQPICPPGWCEWHLWQHTDGRAGIGAEPVPGIGACDRSRFAGTPAELAAWWGR